MKKTNAPGLLQPDNDWKQSLAEIAEQLRIANRLQAIALEALIDKKTSQEELHDDLN